MSLDIREAAALYERHGWPLVKYPAGTKGPRAKGWQNASVPAQQFQPGDNIGIVTGARARGFSDIDLDDELARIIAWMLAPAEWRPWAVRRAGHGNAPGHLFARVVDMPLDFTRRNLTDVGGAGKPSTVIELRATRHQTMMPPSVHPSGEIIEWVDEGVLLAGELPPEVGFEAWQAFAEDVWQLARIARRWGEGVRHDASAALGGWLYHQGIEREEARRMLDAVLFAAVDTEADDRRRALIDSFIRAEGGAPVKGLKALEAALGPKTIAGGRDIRSSRLRRKPHRAAGGATPEQDALEQREGVGTRGERKTRRVGPPVAPDSGRSAEIGSNSADSGALRLVGQEPADASESEERLAVKVSSAYLRDLAVRRERMIWYREAFWDFRDGSYEELERGRVRADVRKSVAQGATPATLGNALSVLEDRLTVGQGRRAPQPAPFDVETGVSLPGGPHIVFDDGVLDVSGERKLLPHDPGHFHEHRVPFKYPRSAEPAPRWAQCIEEWFGEAIGEERLLRQWFGYVISGGLEQERLMALVGQPGSGKSTAAWAVEQLIGPRRVVHATLSSVASRFGLQAWGGKSLAVFEEARALSRRDDAGLAQSRILSISGRDPVEVERKNRDATTEMLGTRLMFVSNKLPDIGDDTGAFHRRLLTVNFERSIEQFDPHLRDKLAAELPGILAWALAGLDDLRAAGGFSETAASIATREADLATSSPLRTFAEQELVFAPGLELQAQVLVDAFNLWARRNSVGEISPHAMARRVRDTFQLQQRRTGTARLWQGVALRGHVADDGNDAFN